jgi:hypothetical protein
MTRREEAVAFLLAHGAVLGTSGDVEALRSPRQRGKRRLKVYGHTDLVCQRKRRYTTEAAARKTAKRMENVDVRPYRCGHCRGWHNGNPPRTKPVRVQR